MIIISWNINGLKGRFDEVRELINTYHPDFVCLQMVRSNTDRDQFKIEGYQSLFSSIDTGNWSGVMTYVKTQEEPNRQLISERLHTPELSKHGHLQAFNCNGFILINAYAPYATDKIPGAMDYRKLWDINLRRFVEGLSHKASVVICGNMNVVRTSKDTSESYLEQDRPGFRDWERKNFEALLSNADLVDTFRVMHSSDNIPSYYTNRRSTDKDSITGNRIDYFLISRPLSHTVVISSILSHFGTAQSVPIIMEFYPDKGDACTNEKSLTDNHVRGNDYGINSHNKTISIQEAALWLTSMAATDGVLTPSELLLIRRFATTYGLDIKSLYRMAYAIANKIEIPEVVFINQSVMKGRKFEEFVVKLTADKSRHTHLNWSSDKYVDGVYSLDTLMPDLLLRHQLDSCMVDYYVECKYRTSLPDGILDLTSQLGRYRRMASAEKRVELFIAVGIGGTPSAPEQFYVIPSRMINKNYIIHIRNFEKCLCPQTPEGFHQYINHYYNRRVFKNS